MKYSRFKGDTRTGHTRDSVCMSVCVCVCVCVGGFQGLGVRIQ